MEVDAKPGVQKDAVCSILDQKHQDVPPATTNPPVPTTTANMRPRLKVTPRRARCWSQKLTENAPSPSSGDIVDKFEPISECSDTSSGRGSLEQPLCQIATYARNPFDFWRFCIELALFTPYGVIIIRKYSISKLLLVPKRDCCQTTRAPVLLMHLPKI